MSIRYNFLKKESVDENIQFYDLISIKWLDFTFPNGYYQHNLTRFDILKPWMISYKYYGDVQYEDFIMLVNGIEHIYDLEPGTEIKIPKLEDIQTFLSESNK